MKLIFLGCCFLCLSGMRAEAKPQITKLFPVPELVDYHQQMSNEVKPLDKFLGKLRATYNFVFRKPENTTNVERILAKDAPNPDVEALKFIWSSRMKGNGENKTGPFKNSAIRNEKTLAITSDDWINDVRPLKPLGSLEPLELETEIVNKEQEVETVETTPGTSLQLPVTLSRHLVEWLGSLLGLTYGVYSKLAKAVHAA